MLLLGGPTFFQPLPEPSEWWILVLPLAFCLGGLFCLVAGLVPVTVVADETGITWHQFLFRKVVSWSDISGIGIGKAHFVIPLPSGMRESVGINLRKNDGIEGAYRRGFTGYDLNIQGDFSPRRESLAERLKEGLELARSREE